MEPKTAINQLEALYEKLMSKDLSPDEEAQAKVQLLEILSSIKAHASIQQGSRAQDVLAQTNTLKELLLNWDPYGSAWFKEDKTLVNNVYNLLAAVKTLLIQAPSAPDNAVLQSIKKQAEEIKSTLQTQIANLSNEVATIKNSLIKLATAFKEHVEKKPEPQQKVSSPQPAPKPVNQSPVSLDVHVNRPQAVPAPSQTPKPVPILKEDLAGLAPKPISLPRPEPLEGKKADNRPKPFNTERPKPIPIPEPRGATLSSPSPQPIPLDEIPGPSLIPLSAPDVEEPIPLDKTDENPQLFGALATQKSGSESQGKQQLFNLFSGGGSASSTETENIEFELEELPFESGGRSGQPFSQPSAPASGDPETLYQELISLEGKRYSIERSIRDLKSDRENGILSDQEYKEKLSQFLNKLQTISKRIEVIRETLD